MRSQPAAKGGGSDFPWSKVSLGYVLNPNADDPDEVRILAGEIDRVAVAQADVTVADNDYIYVRRTLADNTMLVVAASSVPADDSTYVYYRLYRVTVTDGAASIQSIYDLGDINGGDLPSPGADGHILQSNGTAWVSGWGRMKTI